MLWAADVCSQAAFAQSGPVSSISLGRFFSVRVSETDPRPGTWLRSDRVTCSARTGFRAVAKPLVWHHVSCELWPIVRQGRFGLVTVGNVSRSASRMVVRTAAQEASTSSGSDPSICRMTHTCLIGNSQAATETRGSGT